MSTRCTCIIEFIVVKNKVYMLFCNIFLQDIFQVEHIKCVYCIRQFQLLKSFSKP